MNARFQRLMQEAARRAGFWQHFALWLVLLVLWCAAGPLMHWSNSWQLLANTPTTWFELFLGLALLVDGAHQIDMLVRQQEHNEALLERIEELEETILAKLDPPAPPSADITPDHADDLPAAHQQDAGGVPVQIPTVPEPLSAESAPPKPRALVFTRSAVSGPQNRN